MGAGGRGNGGAERIETGKWAINYSPFGPPAGGHMGAGERGAALQGRATGRGQQIGHIYVLTHGAVM